MNNGLMSPKMQQSLRREVGVALQVGIRGGIPIVALVVFSCEVFPIEAIIYARLV
jgi:hypothetical protein